MGRFPEQAEPLVFQHEHKGGVGLAARREGAKKQMSAAGGGGGAVSGQCVLKQRKGEPLMG